MVNCLSFVPWKVLHTRVTLFLLWGLRQGRFQETVQGTGADRCPGALAFPGGFLASRLRSVLPPGDRREP